MTTTVTTHWHIHSHETDANGVILPTLVELVDGLGDLVANLAHSLTGHARNLAAVEDYRQAYLATETAIMYRSLADGIFSRHSHTQTYYNRQPGGWEAYVRETLAEYLPMIHTGVGHLRVNECDDDCGSDDD